MVAEVGRTRGVGRGANRGVGATTATGWVLRLGFDRIEGAGAVVRTSGTVGTARGADAGRHGGRHAEGRTDG